jgi:hypothetical protein
VIVVLASLVAVVAFAAIHLFAGTLRLVDTMPRARGLSLAGGVSVAYVCVRLLPELAAAEDVVRGAAREPLALLEHHVYLLALAGLVTFYGLERTARLSRQSQEEAGAEQVTTGPVFWLQIATFALYNAIIGYLLLHRVDPGARSLVLFVVAIGLHLFVVDHALHGHNPGRYDRAGRFVLMGAVVAGWIVGMLWSVSEVALAVLTAFLGGGVLLNVLKEELPDERQSRFWAFALGAAAYAIILLVH